MTDKKSYHPQETSPCGNPVVQRRQFVHYHGADGEHRLLVTEQSLAVMEDDRWGFQYTLIDTENREYVSTDCIRPLSEKEGAGYYFDDTTGETTSLFMDEEKFTSLFTSAVLKSEFRKKREQQAIEAEEEKRNAPGVERLRNLLRPDSRAVIVGTLLRNECDSQEDYHGSKTLRTVLLAFSTHTRNDFGELRKAAARCPDTAFLALQNPDYEHREMCAMGNGFYLGTHMYHGWQVGKVKIENPDWFFYDFAGAALDEGNLFLAERPQSPDSAAIHHLERYHMEIVDYSPKAWAVVGNTEPVREVFENLGGKHNDFLTHRGDKCPGWVFAKKRTDLNVLRDALKPYWELGHPVFDLLDLPFEYSRMNDQLRPVYTAPVVHNGYYGWEALLIPAGYEWFPTMQDDSIFRRWVNGQNLSSVCYCEGNIVVVTYPDKESYNAGIHRNIKAYGPSDRTSEKWREYEASHLHFLLP